MITKTTHWLFTSLVFNAAIWPATAMAIGISAEVDRNEATLEDQIALTVTVEGNQTATPALPKIPDFEVIAQGQSQQMQIINGAVSSQVVFSYALIPKKAGKFTFPAISVKLGGVLHQTAPISIEIKEPDQTNVKAAGQRELFATASVSNPKPYVSEQVIYTLRFLRRVQVANATVSMPDFSSLAARNLGKQREYETVIDGRRYAVNEFKMAVIADRAGKATIAPASFSCDVAVRKARKNAHPMDGFFGSPFDDFFGRVETEKHVVRAPAIELEVRPLPSPPVGFSGLVGEYALGQVLSKNMVKVGESTTLNLTLTGIGNVSSLPDPSAQVPESFKSYQDKPTYQTGESDAGFQGKKTLSLALVPTQSGQFEILPKNLIFFSPQSGEFKTTSAQTLTVNVSPGDNPEQLQLTQTTGPTPKMAVKMLADDILPNVKNMDAIGSPTFSKTFGAAIFGTSALWPVLFLFTLLWQKNRENQEIYQKRRRRRLALATAQKELRRAEKEKNQNESAARAFRAIRTYVGEKLDLNSDAWTPHDIEYKLYELEAPSDLVEECKTALILLERAQFQNKTLDAEFEKKFGHYQKLLRRLDRALAKQTKAIGR